MPAKRTLLIFLLLFLSLDFLCAQSSSDDPNMVSTVLDMSDFPQWAKDLRRVEVITFGSVPFAYFLSNFGVDVYRSAVNGWDTRYAPWPITSAGGIEQSKDEKIMTLGIAAGGAVLIAIVDYGIMRYKRSKLEKENRNLPDGTPIIIRRPLLEEEADEPEAEPEFLNGE